MKISIEKTIVIAGKKRIVRVTEPKDIIKYIRIEKLGVTQLDFAGIIGVSPATIQNWEQGRTIPSRTAWTLLRIAQENPDILLALAD